MITMKYMLVILLLLDSSYSVELDEVEESSDEEVWIVDMVWENMVLVAAQDFIHRINTLRSVYNVSVDPLQLETLLGARLTMSQWLLGYTVNMEMMNLVLHGLADVVLEQVVVEKHRSMEAVRARMLVRVEKLFLSGRYSMEAVSSTWLMSNISSEGERDLTISLEQVTLGLEVAVSMTETGAEVTDIYFPLEYTDIEFEFDNIGEVVGTALDVIGEVIVENERRKLSDIIKNMIETEVPSLVSTIEDDALTELIREDPIPFFDSFFRNILRREKKELIRDR